MREELTLADNLAYEQAQSMSLGSNGVIESGLTSG